MAVNTTHLNDLLTSASMSFLALSNKSIRHLLVYGARAGSLQFSKPPVPFSIKYAGKTLEVNISIFRYMYLDRTFVFIHHWKKNGGERGQATLFWALRGHREQEQNGVRNRFSCDLSRLTLSRPMCELCGARFHPPHRRTG